MRRVRAVVARLVVNRLRFVPCGCVLVCKRRRGCDCGTAGPFGCSLRLCCAGYVPLGASHRVRHADDRWHQPEEGWLDTPGSARFRQRARGMSPAWPSPRNCAPVLTADAIVVVVVVVRALSKAARTRPSSSCPRLVRLPRSSRPSRPRCRLPCASRRASRRRTWCA